MVYDVILTDLANTQLDQIIHYLLFKIGSSQAARNVLEDAENTKIRLSHLAGSLKLCEDSRLRQLGYRTIHFKNHKFFMIYRIENHHVYVDGIYHDLQDYENLI